MNKFKVGDRVKVISNSYIVSDYKSQEGYISKIQESNSRNDRIYKVDLINYTNVIDKISDKEHNKKVQLLNWFYDEELELVNESVADQVLKHINITGGNKMENKKTIYSEKIIKEIREKNNSENGNIKFGDLNAKNRKRMYHIGDIMIRGNQLNRLCELQDLSDLNLNVDCYSAMLNEKINDKSGVTEEQNNKLAEHIYKADIDRLFDADIIVGEVLSSSIGSMCEMAMLDGFKLCYEKMEDIFNSELNNDEKLTELNKLKDKLNKDIYYHSFDLRNTNLKECGWRRSHSINQLQYAFMMHSATDGDILPWEEILEKLEKRYGNYEQ